MLYLPYIPEGALGRYVELIFYLQNYHPEHQIERLVPDGSINIIIELDGRKRYIFDNETLKEKPKAPITAKRDTRRLIKPGVWIQAQLPEK